MNSKELGMFIAFRNTPELYRITDGGTKLYTLVHGVLVCFEGEGLNEMTAQQLYDFYQKKLLEYLREFG